MHLSACWTAASAAHNHMLIPSQKPHFSPINFLPLRIIQFINSAFEFIFLNTCQYAHLSILFFYMHSMFFFSFKPKHKDCLTCTDAGNGNDIRAVFFCSASNCYLALLPSLLTCCLLIKGLPQLLLEPAKRLSPRSPLSVREGRRTGSHIYSLPQTLANCASSQLFSFILSTLSQTDTRRHTHVRAPEWLMPSQMLLSWQRPSGALFALLSVLLGVSLVKPSPVSSAVGFQADIWPLISAPRGFGLTILHHTAQ